MDGAVSDGPYARLMAATGNGRRVLVVEGCPYEEAEALMDGDLAAAKRALEMFQTLGAVPASRGRGSASGQLGARGSPGGGGRALVRIPPA